MAAVFHGVVANSQSIAQQKGLTTVTFSTNNGTVSIFLPQKIRHGDRITAGFSLAAAGKNEKQKQKALEGLKESVLQIGNENAPLPMVNATYYSAATGLLKSFIVQEAINIRFTGVRQNTVAANIVPPNLVALSASNCQMPSHAVCGDPFSIQGPFDGDASNTKCTLEKNVLQVLAESPRECIVQYPSNAAGLQTLKVQEVDRQHCAQEIQSVQMHVSAGKLNLLKGESTHIDILISGLQGLNGLAMLELNNTSADIVSLLPANNVFIPLNPDSVSDGIFQRRFVVQSIKTGTYTINVNLSLPDDAKDQYADMLATNENNKTDTVPCRSLEEKVKAAEDALAKLITELAGIDNLIAGTQKRLDDCNKVLEGLLAIYHAKKKVADEQEHNKANWEKSGKKFSDANQKKLDNAEKEMTDAANDWSAQHNKCKALANELAALKQRKAALPGLIEAATAALAGAKADLEKCKSKAAEEKKKKEDEETKKPVSEPQAGEGNIHPGTGADKEGSPCDPDGVELVEPAKRVYGSCYVKETEITPCNTSRISNEVLEAVKKAFEKFKNLKGPLEIAEKIASCASTAKAVCVNIHLVRDWEDVQLTYVCVNGKWVLKNRKVIGRGQDDYGWFIVKDKETGNLCCWIFGKKEDAENAMEAHLKEAIQGILDACK